MRAAGYTAVGEFHYLGVPEAHAAHEAAAAAGVEVVLLHVAYARGGLPRFRQGSVSEYLVEVEELRARGCVSASPPLRARVPGGLARGDRALRRGRGTPAPRPRRRAAAGDRGVHRRARLPPGRAARAHGLPRRTGDGRPCDARGRRRARPPGRRRRHRLRVPDHRGRPRRRLLPAERIRTRAIPLSIGPDSNVRIDPFEELRELEASRGVRRQEGRLRPRSPSASARSRAPAPRSRLLARRSASTWATRRSRGRPRRRPRGAHRGCVREVVLPT